MQCFWEKKLQTILSNSSKVCKLWLNWNLIPSVFLVWYETKILDTRRKMITKQLQSFYATIKRIYSTQGCLKYFIIS